MRGLANLCDRRRETTTYLKAVIAHREPRHIGQSLGAVMMVALLATVAGIWRHHGWPIPRMRIEAWNGSENCTMA